MTTRHLKSFFLIVLDHVCKMTSRAIRPWLLRILEFSLVGSVTDSCFKLHEGNFGPQSVTFSMDKIFT